MKNNQYELYDMVSQHNETAQNLVNERAVLPGIPGKKVSSKKRIETVLFRQGHITNVEAARLLEGSAGQLSWGQRLRDIRRELIEQGKELDCVAQGNGVFDYIVIE